MRFEIKFTAHCNVLAEPLIRYWYRIIIVLVFVVLAGYGDLTLIDTLH